MIEETIPDASSSFQESLPIHPDTVISQLKSLKITIEQFKHPALKTVSDSKSCRHNMLTKNKGGGHIKNLYLRDQKKNNYLIVVQEDKNIDLKELGILIESGRLSFGSAVRLFENLGVRPGAVTPLSMVTGVQNGVNIFMDEELLEAKKIYMHPLVNDRTISIIPSELNKYFDYLGVQLNKLSF